MEAGQRSLRAILQLYNATDNLIKSFFDPKTICQFLFARVHEAILFFMILLESFSSCVLLWETV